MEEKNYSGGLFINLISFARMPAPVMYIINYLISFTTIFTFIQAL